MKNVLIISIFHIKFVLLYYYIIYSYLIFDNMFLECITMIRLYYSLIKFKTNNICFSPINVKLLKKFKTNAINVIEIEYRYI